MTPPSTLLILLLLAPTLLRAAPATNISVPFNSTLVGQQFTFIRSGVRFPILARLDISQTALAYFPRYQTQGPLSPLDPFCFRSYQLLLNRDVKQLKFVSYAQNSPGCDCDGCVEATNTTFATGESAETFQEDVRFLFRATRALRNSDGSERNLCFGDCQPRRRPELDAILTYLYGIAYSLGFCVES